LLEQAHKLAASAASSGVQELAFRLDSSVYDGRFANNGWLQEMPDPISKLTWDNAAWLNPADAAAFGVANGDTCELSLGDDPERRCVVAAYLMPGQASGTIGLSLGYGRTLAGSLGSSIGFNVYPVWTVSGLTAPTFAHIRRLGNRHSFALTQDHHQIDALGAAGRTERIGELHHSGSIYHEATWHEYQRDANSVRVAGHGPQELQLFDPPSDFRQPHAWGMAIDLSKCIGCAACVIACQAENNIPIVGKDQVRRNREMHWIRIDTYFKGGDDQPEFAHMPMTCHHCETAPCEQVCPVAATVHDSEGLNAMVYNRCIGTRYCSNNCPAKVRRFNFYDFHATEPDQTRKPWIGIPDAQPAADIDPLRQLQFNPEVTIRMRGVMEKCTFCTQRIQAAKIAARVANAQGLRDSPLVRDGEVVPACASACPAGAIEFGDLNNPSSRVSQAHADPRAYAFLEELQLRPRTRYLAKLRNPVNGATDSSISEGHG
jgi:molybdopterin-containing oxidoreductase family iron-sulfur binding subunit